VNPGAYVPDGYLIVRATTDSGRTVNGTRAAEDPFMIWIATPDGRFAAFRKSGLRSVERFPGRSAMPAFARLGAGALEDLVAYLAGLKETR
jgi:hypothetical protein